MSYSKQHLREAAEIVAKLDPALCEKAVELLAAVRARGGRLFILGVGGSAARGVAGRGGSRRRVPAAGGSGSGSRHWGGCRDGCAA